MGVPVGSILAQGQLGTTQAEVYRTPVGKRSYIAAFRVLALSGPAQTVVVYLKKSGGTATEIDRCELTSAFWSAEFVEGPLWPLNAGDAVEAKTTTAAVVNYTLMGGEAS